MAEDGHDQPEQEYHEEQTVQQDQRRAPQGPPYAITEKLPVGDEVVNGDEPIQPRGNPGSECAENQHQRAHEELEENAFGPGMAVVAGRKAEQDPGGEDQEKRLDQHAPAQVVHQPGNGFGQHLEPARFRIGVTAEADPGQFQDQRNHHGHQKQQADRRNTYFPPATRIIADQMSGTPQEIGDGRQRRISVDAEFFHLLPD